MCNVGGRQAPDIVNWLKKKTGPPAVTYDTIDAAKAGIEKEEVIVFGFFKVSVSSFNVLMTCKSNANEF